MRSAFVCRVPQAAAQALQGAALLARLLAEECGKEAPAELLSAAALLHDNCLLVSITVCRWPQLVASRSGLLTSGAVEALLSC